MMYAASPLTQVMNDLGRNILEEMKTNPSLTAAVDQHVAAIRDAVADRDGRIARKPLLGYLLGILDVIRDGTWADTQFPVSQSWPSLRLAAVCWLAREHGHLSRGGPGG